MLEKVVYALVRWPWIAGVVVLAAMTQLPLGGPWYLGAWLAAGAALFAMLAARSLKLQMVEGRARKLELDGRRAQRAAAFPP